jgi:ribulose-bisphosphate carboxylase large chain
MSVSVRPLGQELRIPEVIEAMRACVKKTAASKRFSANVTVDDPVERSLVASMSVADRPLGQELRLLVDGCVGGGTAITVARRNFPEKLARTISRRLLTSPRSLQQEKCERLHHR